MAMWHNGMIMIALHMKHGYVTQQHSHHCNLLVGYSSNAFNLNLTLTLVLTLTLIPALTIDFPMGQCHCNVKTLLCNIVRIHIPETYIVVSRHTSSALPNNVQIQHCHEDFLYTQNNNLTTVYIADETSSMTIAQKVHPQRQSLTISK